MCVQMCVSAKLSGGMFYCTLWYMDVDVVDRQQLRLFPPDCFPVLSTATVVQPLSDLH